MRRGLRWCCYSRGGCWGRNASAVGPACRQDRNDCSEKHRQKNILNQFLLRHCIFSFNFNQLYSYSCIINVIQHLRYRILAHCMTARKDFLREFLIDRYVLNSRSFLRQAQNEQQAEGLRLCYQPVEGVNATCIGALLHNGGQGKSKPS